jgi:hypothetical protein
VFKQQAVNGFAPDLFQIFRPGPDNQIGSRDCRKAIGGTGTAEQTIKKGFFYFSIPMQTPLNDGAQKGQSSASHPGLMAGGSEDRACHLTEPAAVAVGNFVVVFGDVGTIHLKYI